MTSKERFYAVTQGQIVEIVLAAIKFGETHSDDDEYKMNGLFCASLNRFMAEFDVDACDTENKARMDAMDVKSLLDPKSISLAEIPF